VSANS